MKIIWRFNLAPGIEERAFFAWLRHNVWASSSKAGCETRAFRLQGGAHAYSTEATWPSIDARDRWQGSADFAAIPNYPGLDSPWAAQIDLERVIANEMSA